MSPATDDEVSEYRPKIIEKANPFNSPPKFPCHQPPKISSDDGKVTLSEVLMVPVQKYPKYNFVGRILGPRGMTVKQLEKETGCKIFVKGRASSTSVGLATKQIIYSTISVQSAHQSSSAIQFQEHSVDNFAVRPHRRTASRAHRMQRFPAYRREEVESRGHGHR